MLKKTLSIALLALVIISFSSSLSSPVKAFWGDDLINVVLDPGHGGMDSGAIGAHYEKYYNLKVAEYCAAKLRANGNFNVYMTRTTDGENLTLLERGLYADRVNADLLVSIHFNSGTDPSRRGIEVYSSVLDRFDIPSLASSFSNTLSYATGIPTRGCFRRYDNAGYYWSEQYQWDVPDDPSVGGLSDYYGIITWAAKFGFPGIIIEHAYISNATDTAICENEETLRKMGEADADAIIAYYTNHTHTYTSWYVKDYPVSCFTAGKQSIHCTVCGHRKNVTSLAAAPDPNAHYWVAEEKVDATCQHPGSANMYCRYMRNFIEKGGTNYSEHKIYVEIPQLAHNFRQVEYREASCSENGIDRKVCSTCGDEQVEIFPAKGHSPVFISHTDPTCTTDGEDLYRCSVCGGDYSVFTPATGHSWVETGRVEPKCVEEGSLTHKCSVCGEVETLPIPALGHELTETARTEPTCLDEGSVSYLCSRCKEEITEALEPLGHDFQVVEREEPTCLEEGIAHYKCSRCDEKKDEKLEALGHDPKVIERKEPNCTKAGVLKTRCSRCDLEETQKLDALGHDYKVKSSTESCDKEGKKELICSRCKETYIEKVPPLGHDYKEEARVEATEEQDGYVRFKCSRCGEEYTEVISYTAPSDDTEGFFAGLIAKIKESPVLIAAIAGAAAMIAAALAILIRRRSKPTKSGAHDTPKIESKADVGMAENTEAEKAEAASTEKAEAENSENIEAENVKKAEAEDAEKSEAENAEAEKAEKAEADTENPESEDIKEKAEVN